ncbi:MAG: 50S ribosomal protein L9 [Clostridiales Family XIII bacterium]|jgi:large subunit ribosomal protein L9|nr:50S ribosomal protein L9 [Clostridiales Family XIII bacterium]
MKVILLEDVVGVGKAGDVAQVKKGFARNFLLPKGIVIEANESNMKTLEHRRAKIAAKKAADKDAAELFAKQLEGKVLNFVAKAGEGGKLFGSVTTGDIAEEILDKLGFEVDRRKIDIEGTIKEIGEHDVPIRIYPEVVATIKVLVEPEGGLLEKASISKEEEIFVADEAATDDTAAEEIAEEDLAAEEAADEEGLAEEEAAAEEAQAEEPLDAVDAEGPQAAPEDAE